MDLLNSHGNPPRMLQLVSQGESLSTPEVPGCSLTPGTGEDEFSVVHVEAAETVVSS